ncbi:hypothetical protein AX16_008958 [Volvariella volvacea WC 439]|nr:hypothetical protein AX16_008958 [Volvariella volvacea WC 439]
MNSSNSISSHEIIAEYANQLPLLPPEILSQVFALACWDGGYTGGSLAAVSQSFNALSAPYRYQSIAICGEERLLSLLPVLQSLPSDKRKIISLFFSEFPLSMNQPPTGPEAQPPAAPSIVRREAFDFQNAYFTLLQLATPTLRILHEYRRASGTIDISPGMSINWSTRSTLQFPVLKEYAVAHLERFELPSRDPGRYFTFNCSTTQEDYDSASDNDSEAEFMVVPTRRADSLPPDTEIQRRFDFLFHSWRMHPGYSSTPQLSTSLQPFLHSNNYSIEFSSMSNNGMDIPNDIDNPLDTTEESAAQDLDDISVFRTQDYLDPELELKLWKETSCFPSLECLHITQATSDKGLVTTIPKSVKHLRVEMPSLELNHFICTIEEGIKEAELSTIPSWHMEPVDSTPAGSSHPHFPTFLSPWNLGRTVYISHPNSQDSSYNSHLKFLMKRTSGVTWVRILGLEFEAQETDAESMEWCIDRPVKVWQEGVRKARDGWLDRIRGKIWWSED